MSGETPLNMTKEDVRKPESQASKAHGGNVPADSPAAAAQVPFLPPKRPPNLLTHCLSLQSIVDSAGDKSKAQLINERQANLPLPDQPPAAPDTASGSAAGSIGSGAQPTGGFSKGDDALRTATGAESQAGVGREGIVGGLPNDAATRGKKDQSSLVDTTGKDYGYPAKSDPADTSKLP